MAKKYQEKVFFTIEELKRIHTLINMTAEELYIRYGKKRGELIFERQTIFEDARSLDISYRVGNESNEKAQISVVLKNPDENIVSDVSEDYDDTQIIGTFSATDESLHDNPEDCLTSETVDTPRGNFRVVDMGVEQMEAAGYGYHHMSNDGQWFIFGNGTRAYAISVENGCKDCYNEYKVEVKLARCAIPLRCDNGKDGELVAYIDSDWLLNNCEEEFSEYGGIFGFLDQYTSEDSTDIIAKATLAGAVLFVYDPDEDEPFEFPNDDGWKYRAFADAMSDIICKDNPEVSRAIDCFLDL